MKNDTIRFSKCALDVSDFQKKQKYTRSPQVVPVKSRATRAGWVLKSSNAPAIYNSILSLIIECTFLRSSTYVIVHSAIQVHTSTSTSRWYAEWGNIKLKWKLPIEVENKVPSVIYSQ